MSTDESVPLSAISVRIRILLIGHFTPRPVPRDGGGWDHLGDIGGYQYHNSQYNDEV